MNYSNPELIENSLYETGWSHNEPVAGLNKLLCKNYLFFRPIDVNKNNKREDVLMLFVQRLDAALARCDNGC